MVVRAGLGVEALRAGFAERRAYAVDEHDVTCGTRHGRSSSAGKRVSLRETDLRELTLGTESLLASNTNMLLVSNH
jgi:hypothetical protein